MSRASLALLALNPFMPTPAPRKPRRKAAVKSRKVSTRRKRS